MVDEIADLDLVVTDTEIEALALENNLIKRHKPRYNVLLRDDKNHPYLKLTLAEEYPRLHVVRRPREDGNAYGGPYIPASLARRRRPRPQALRRALLPRGAGRHRPRPCLQYQIKRCLAPCVAEICSLDALPADPARTRGSSSRDDRRGGGRLRGQMDEAAAGERFEEAARLRDQVRALERLEAPQKITTTELEERDLFGIHVEGERAAVQVFTVRDGQGRGAGGLPARPPHRARAVLGRRSSSSTPRGATCRARSSSPRSSRTGSCSRHWLAARRGARVRSACPQRGEKLRLLELVARNAELAFELEWKHPRQQSQEILRALRDLLDLEVEPRRIECFDISNIQGSDIVASMVVFVDGRRRNPTTASSASRLAGAPDDFASMREVVGRRYRRLLEEGKDLPDLVLIDGGKGSSRPRSTPSRSWASATSRWPAWPNARS